MSELPWDAPRMIVVASGNAIGAVTEEIMARYKARGYHVAAHAGSLSLERSMDFLERGQDILAGSIRRGRYDDVVLAGDVVTSDLIVAYKAAKDPETLREVRLDISYCSVDLHAAAAAV